MLRRELCMHFRIWFGIVSGGEKWLHVCSGGMPVPYILVQEGHSKEMSYPSCVCEQLVRTAITSEITNLEVSLEPDR